MGLHSLLFYCIYELRLLKTGAKTLLYDSVTFDDYLHILQKTYLSDIK